MNNAHLFVMVALLALHLSACSGSDGGNGDAAPGDIVTGETSLDLSPGDTPVETGAETTPDVPPDSCCDDVAPELPDLFDDSTEVGEVEVTDDIEPDLEPPCQEDGECDDGDYCTSDTCIDGLCLNQGKDCYDGNKCTDDSCDPATGQCQNPQLECDDGNTCTLDTCMPTTGCDHIPIEGCCPGTLISEEGFEVFPEGWTVEDEVTAEGGEATWQVSTARFHDGAASLYFGNLEQSNYDVGGRVRSYVETPLISLTSESDTELHFWLWLDVEKVVNYDTLSLFVETNGDLVPLFAKKQTTQMKKWFEVVLDLQAFAGQEVRFRLVFDSLDESDNYYEGVYIDSFRLYEKCPKEDCVTKVDCNDMLPCTLGHCIEGNCTYDIMNGCCLNSGDCADDDPCTIESCKNNICDVIEIAPPYCCYVPADCDDGNDCTDDICDESGICLHPPSTAPGCCTEDEACNDNDSCTIDKCEDNTCFFVNTCCFAQEDCDDGDDVCTDDACVGGACVYSPTGVDGCCLSPLFKDDFSEDLGWDYGPEWGRGPTSSGGTGYGSPDPANDHTSSDDNYVAGVVIGGTASTSLHGYYYLTSPVINTGGASNLRLIFWRWLNSDYTPYMQNVVEV